MTRTLRLAGVRPPQYAPQVEMRRVPMWERNLFARTGNPDNAPIYDVEGDPPGGGAPATSSIATVTKGCYHNHLPGTAYSSQVAASAMQWAVDKFFAFKCYVEFDDVAGRIPLFYQRSSLQNGGPFIEIRDGHIYAGWYDTEQKREVCVKTSAPVIQPGYIYYIYYRKFFPRNGLAVGGNPFYTPSGSNWANSVHCGGITSVKNFCYDALIWRRFPRVAQTTTVGSPKRFSDWTGYDAKSYLNSPSGGANYDYFTALSSVRACVSATIADSSFGVTNPYTLALKPGPSGCVMFEALLDQGNTTANTVALDTGASNFRFLLDHVGMLLQISDTSTFPSAPLTTIYRIVEFVSATKVKVCNVDGSSPSFNYSTDTQKISVCLGVSLVKSEGYDASHAPDTDSYAIECFGSSLSSNPLNGVQPFRGRRWSFAYGMFTNGGAVVDGGGNKVGKPAIFEDGVKAINAAAGAGQQRITSCVEMGTDVFGIQGSTNPLDGSLPFQGVPAGELQVDTNFAHTAVDTTPGYDITWGVPATIPSAIAPSSTQPNVNREAALDAVSTSTDKHIIQFARPVTPGKRLLRVSFYDPDNDEESTPGELQSINIPIESSNPSSAMSLVLTGLPSPIERGRRIVRRIRLSLANATDLFLAADIEDPSAFSCEVPIDDIAMQQFGAAIGTAALIAQFGTPPRGKYVAFSQNRLILGNLDGQEDGVAFSNPFTPGEFPRANIFPIDTGAAGITGLAEMHSEFTSAALIVFKRNAMLAYQFNSLGIPILSRSRRCDGCVAHNTILSVEDRIYYLSDRGPMVLLSDLTPYFIGWRTQGLFKKAVELTELAFAHAGLNRRRGQYLVTYQEKGTTRTERRLGIEFTHPSSGEDTTRAELTSGHRFNLYEQPSCTALASVQARDGGEPLLAGGTEEGFGVWLDRDDTLYALPSGQPADVDTALEGPFGTLARYLVNGVETARRALFDTGSALYVDGPTEVNASWLTLGAMLARWSSKEVDAESPELDKNVYYLDVSRGSTPGGALQVDLYSNLDSAPVGSVTLPLTESFSSLEIGAILQESRSFRFVFRTQTPTAGQDFELLNLTVRPAEVDSK